MDYHSGANLATQERDRIMVPREVHFLPNDSGSEQGAIQAHARSISAAAAPNVGVMLTYYVLPESKPAQHQGVWSGPL